MSTEPWAYQTLACSSCHDPSKAFAQDVAVPTVYGQRTGTRNVPSLQDLPHFTHFFWDGREERLDQAAVAAFTNQAEMAQPDMSAVIRAVSQKPDYRIRFKAAFGNEHVDQERISSSILAYLASVTTGRSRYDAFVAGNTAALTTAERRGLDVFRGKPNVPHVTHWREHRLLSRTISFTIPTSGWIGWLGKSAPPLNPLKPSASRVSQ
ncbi:cytochrome-c peroxidase [Xanthomonas phaseoli pv. phaseoli]|uniref:cytochrome-c peroxidase n=1 Tax=Xanthomonas phaseoli TaxID=1985254 RepID=UPI0020542CF7|nr:cytochrome-c peroxidase [Xanthomonas phaseoli]UNW12523.1 cytochrome-c peroxidase [Xanthomonas phaseoli pv. phaseoli]UZB12716.1 cytochrome-c peroxidase [Xanthomonas phaseoli pv. phaseoli]